MRAEETARSISEEALASLDAAQEKVWLVEEKVERVLKEAMEGTHNDAAADGRRRCC